MFKIQEKGKPETAVWLTGEETLICSDGSGDILLDSVSDKVCKIKIENNGDKLYLADLSFNETILINGRVLPTGSRLNIKHGDTVSVVGKTFEIVNAKQAVAGMNTPPAPKRKPWKLKAEGNWLDGQVFTLGNKTVIGRDSTCDITIPGSHLSRKHAVFVTAANKLSLKDLDSANGTYVNGEKVSEKQLRNGDEVKLDTLAFKVIAPDDSNIKADMRQTVMNPAIRLPEKNADGTDKAWVTKPTSIGNRENDSLDVLLAKQKRHKNITYAVFGTMFILFVLGAYMFIR